MPLGSEEVGTLSQDLSHLTPPILSCTSDRGCLGWPSPMSAGSLPLEEAAALFDRATLEQLKEECGGVQTLLRNHHQVFEGALAEWAQVRCVVCGIVRAV